MIFFALFSLFMTTLNYASETSVSLALRNISMHEAIARFDTQILLPHNATIGQEIANRKVKLYFNCQNKHILLQALHEADANAVRDLIQQHIDV